MDELTESEVLRKISDTSELLSVLYDADLLPEQTANEPDLYRRTILIAAAWPTCRAAPDALVEVLKKTMPAMFAARNRLANIDHEECADNWIIPLEEAWEAARVLVRPDAPPLVALRPVERGEEGADGSV